MVDGAGQDLGDAVPAQISNRFEDETELISDGFSVEVVEELRIGLQELGGSGSGGEQQQREAAPDARETTVDERVRFFESNQRMVLLLPRIWLCEGA